MSRKYIGQINKNNFVYPNNTLAEYDVDIVHDINNNSVSGTTSGFSALYNSGTGNIGISFTYIWNKNGADPFIDENNLLHVLSVHMSEPTKKYYKPWRMISGVTTSTITATTKTDTFLIIVTPAMMGLTTFSSGVYDFEIRFIGKRAIYPLCYTTSIMIVTPTPTPPVPCYCYPIVVTGSTLPPPEGGFIATLDYNNCDGERVGRLFQVGPGTYYQCIQTVDGVVQYFEGTNGIDTSYLTIPGVGNCNTGYDCTGYVPAGSTPTPTPTVTVTPTNGYVAPTSTPTPTHTVTPTVTPTSGYVAPTSTPTPTPTVTPTSGTTTYDYYLADQYECLTPSGCSFSTSNVPVAFPSGYSYIGTHYYQPIAPNGYVYKITSSSTYAVSTILDTSLHSSNCSTACSIT